MHNSTKKCHNSYINCWGQCRAGCRVKLKVFNQYLMFLLGNNFWGGNQDRFGIWDNCFFRMSGHPTHHPLILVLSSEYDLCYVWWENQLGSVYFKLKSVENKNSVNPLKLHRHQLCTMKKEIETDLWRHLLWRSGKTSSSMNTELQ